MIIFMLNTCLARTRLFLEFKGFYGSQYKMQKNSTKMRLKTASYCWRGGHRESILFTSNETFLSREKLRF